MYNPNADPAVQNYKHLDVGQTWCAECGKATTQPIYWCGTSARCIKCHMERMTDDKGYIRQIFGSIIEEKD